MQEHCEVQNTSVINFMLSVTVHVYFTHVPFHLYQLQAHLFGMLVTLNMWL